MKFFVRHKALTAFVLILILLSAGCIRFVSDKLNRISYSDGKTETLKIESETGNEAVKRAEAQSGETQNEEEQVIDQEEFSKLEEAEANYSDMEIFTDSDVFNILLLGTDEREPQFSKNARADSIMILSLDKEEKTMKLVSLERGMGVPILEGQYRGQYDWLTHCFRYGGADLMLKEVQECLRVDISRYVRVNFNTFAQLIDSVGGVDVELTELEKKGLNGEVRTNARTRVKVHVGMNHLDGYDALQYTRLRYTDSDWQRIRRQRNVIQSVVYAAKGMNLLQLNSAADEVLPLIQTNLTKTEILELAAFAPNVLGKEIGQMSIPKEGTYGGMKGMGGRSLYAVDFEENAEILKAFLYGEDAE